MSIKESGKIILEYLDKWPKLPSMTLSRKVYNENKHMFSSVESVRASIRMYRGKCGYKNRHRVKNLEHTNDTPSLPQMPESIAKSWTPFILKDAGRVLVMADIHLPYHNKLAIDTALASEYDTVLLNGDIADHYALSRFNKRPDQLFFKTEIKVVKEFFAYLRTRNKGRIIWKIGNHEERLIIYLIQKAPELFDCDFLSHKDIFKTDDYGIEVVSDKRVIKAGKLNIIHGHEFNGGSSAPVNAARSLFLKGYDNAFQNHCHRPSSSPEVTMSGKMISCWSGGCLCDLHPEYARLNKWMHGYAILETDGDDFNIENKKIINGRAYPA